MNRGEGTVRRVGRSWFGLLSLGLCLFAACGGKATGPIEGSGGAITASGGTATATGGVGSGGSGSGGSGGTSVGESGGTTAEGGVPLTAEEAWQALVAPRSGPHDVWTVENCNPPHTGSNSVPIGQEYSVIPTLNYAQAADFDYLTYHAYDAFVADYCVTSAECTDEPGGSCRGRIGDAFCQYSDPPPPELCSTAAECTKKPGGSCEFPFGPEPDRICYPSGACVEPAGECAYSDDEPCTADADCTERPDGKCIFPIEYAQCWYGVCFEDGDCPGGERCFCGRCHEDHCGLGNDDCGDGETCEFDLTGCHVSPAFYCTTPRDECEVSDVPDCVYEGDEEGGHWSPRANCVLK